MALHQLLQHELGTDEKKSIKIFDFSDTMKLFEYLEQLE